MPDAEDQLSRIRNRMNLDFNILIFRPKIRQIGHSRLLVMRMLKLTYFTLSVQPA